MKKAPRFRFFSQLEMVDCGPACLQMVSHFHDKRYTIAELRDLCKVTRAGITLQDINVAAREMGFDTLVGRVDITKLGSVPLPCILHWNQEHFVVLYKIREHGVKGRNIYSIADPGFGTIRVKEEAFLRQWNAENGQGIALLLEPGERFESTPPQYIQDDSTKRTLAFIRHHLSPLRGRLGLLSLFLGLGAATTWFYPPLMAKLIDRGVNGKNLNIIIIVLLAQLSLFLGQALVEWLRGIMSAHVSTRLSTSIILDFTKKLFGLPIKFFDTKLHTDILQRIDDHAQIEGFLTHMVINFIFSLLTFFLLSIQLIRFNTPVFVIYFVLSIASVIWLLLFLKKRKLLDYARFRVRADNRNVLFETITGMPEVKLNNAQNRKLELLRDLQKRIYGLNVRNAYLFQFQQLGTRAINQLKNIIVTFFCAYLVIQGHMTLGVMMTVGFIMGQLIAPLEGFVDFFRSAQDARIALNRLDEIQKKKDENDETKRPPPHAFLKGLQLRNVSFKYEGGSSPYVLQNVSLDIPKGKITAIVGTSGSGKTTLMKLLLNFYDPQRGTIFIDNLDMAQVNSDAWRDRCGIVMQDGFIFSGTIADNIALADEKPNREMLEFACRMACLDEFIRRLPMGLNTKIGNSGTDLSGGQKQRILIARAIYKRPDLIFFDEATSSLDANNEKAIMENLSLFFQGKTVVIIAHRLSTVKNADQIIVLQQGKIVEIGNHELLTQEKSYYFELVKNQLELGV